MIELTNTSKYVNKKLSLKLNLKNYLIWKTLSKLWKIKNLKFVSFEFKSLKS